VARFIVDRLGGGITYIPAREGLDSRYCLDDTKLRGLGWHPTGDFWADLEYQIQVEKGLQIW
jgi:dTDP-D-glucose 4,6-dehydratase